jgi:hypothetical protein
MHGTYLGEIGSTCERSNVGWKFVASDDTTLTGFGEWFLPLLFHMAEAQDITEDCDLIDLGNVLLIGIGAAVRWNAVPFLFLDPEDGAITLDDYDLLDLGPGASDY